MIEIVGLTVIVIGVLFNLFGCIGLVRLPDVYNRLQAATKCVTVGTCSVLLGVLILHGFDPLGIKALIAIPLLFLTAPTAAHALARGSHHFGVRLWSGSVGDAYEEDDRGGPDR